MRQPNNIIFKDDGSIPNSGFAVLLFRGAVDLDEEDPASSMEERFAANHWTDSWRNGIYPFTIIIAPVTKCSASIEAQPLFGSAENKGKILSWRRAM